MERKYFLPFFLYQLAVFLLALLITLAGKALGLYGAGLATAVALLFTLEFHAFLTTTRWEGDDA